MYFFFRFFKNEENLKKNTSTSGCIEKYISLVKMYKKIRNRKIELKKKIITISYTSRTFRRIAVSSVALKDLGWSWNTYVGNLCWTLEFLIRFSNVQHRLPMCLIQSPT